MKAPGRLPVVVCTILTLASWLNVATVASAADPPAEKLLEGLRRRGYYDMAILYLEQMRATPDCPADLKDITDYEIGVTLLEAADATETVSARETNLDAATEAIQRFLKEHPAHEKAGPASTQIGRVLLLRGAVRAQQAEAPGISADEKKAKLTEARKYFDQAQTALEGAENRCYAKAKELQDRAQIDERAKEKLKTAFGELLQARLLLVNIVDRRARTYDSDSKEYKEQLAGAAKRYNELFEKNDEQIGGLQARNFEGKVYCDLGQNQKAIDTFREMLALPDGSQAIRGLKLQALVWLMETYLKPDVKKYDEAIEATATWKDAALPNEESSNEGLRVQLLAGQACLEAAKALDEKDKKQKDLLRSARRYLEFVQRAPGPIRKEASNLLMDDLLGAPVQASDDTVPETFAEALEQANVTWLRMLTTDGQVRQATDPDKKAELSEQLADARRIALKNCRLALELADEKTDVSQINTIRFYLTYLYFKEQRLYDSAVMGELLAYRYPQSVGARKGAEIAIAAYRTLFDIERRASRDTTFEMEQMERLAQYVTTRWEDDPVAEGAWVMLFDTAVDLEDVEKATSYLEKLPPDSSRRANAELRLGRMYWSQYVNRVNLDEGERPSQDELDSLVKKAQDTLRQGIDRMSEAVEAGGEPTYDLATSVLTLAQILIDAGNAKEAVQWLDDSKIGPMTLIGANSLAVAGRTDFQIDTYKAALRAYVGAEMLEQAEAVMGQLEELVGQQDAAGATRLTQIYISLGRQLEELLKRLQAEGKTDEIQKVSQGFEKFLDTISRRKQGNSFSSLNWVAQTFLSLGAGLDPGDGPLPEAALRYYKTAGETYYNLLQKPPADMPEGAETTIKVQLAICLRALGRGTDDPAKAKQNFVDALKLLVGILKEKETRVDVQKEAARTYQEMARAVEQPNLYRNAILGGQKQSDGRYLIWGWNGISRRVASNEKFRSEFFESRYNIAVCRMRLAQTQKGDERAATLKMAENDIVVTYKLYPTLGGPEWFDKYDALLKAIRKFQGNDNPKGLKDDK